MQENEKTEVSKQSFGKRALLFLIPVIGVILWRSPLRESLWLDETVTYWVISGTLFDVFVRAYEYQGQSAFYFVIAWFTKGVLGTSELMLRAPSLLMVGATCVVLYKLAVHFFDRETAAFSVLVFVCVDEVMVAAFSARPYGLALFLSTASVLALVRWLQSGKGGSRLAYLLLTLSTLYCHYLFAAVLVLHVLIFLKRDKESCSVGADVYCITLVYIGVLFIPAYSHLMFLFDRSGSLSFAAQPDLLRLLKTIFPPHIALYVICGIVFSVSSKKFRYRPVLTITIPAFAMR